MLSFASFNLWQMGFVLPPMLQAIMIVVPPAGALVRFRAHYNPKGLQLDPEGNIQPRTSPVNTSFIATLTRVHKIEGQSGFYKGLIPMLLFSFIPNLFLSLSLRNSNIRYRIYTWNSSTGILGMLVYSLFIVLLWLPPRIITDRAITTPHKLPYFNAIYSLRILLTPTERRRPWILYLTPGLFATQVFYTAYSILWWRAIRWFLLPELGWHNILFANISVIRLAIFIVLALANAAVFAPLEIITTRLAIQRNHATPEFNSVSQEEEVDAEETVEYVGVDEDVISLRTEQVPYVGLIDCAKKIVDEEGWTTLYRAWWLTMFGCLTGVCVALIGMFRLENSSSLGAVLRMVLNFFLAFQNRFKFQVL